MTRRLHVLAAAVLVAVGLGACGGSSGGNSAPPPTPSSVAATQAPAGLVNDVKRAAVVAVCTDLKQASELVGTGIATDQVRAAVLAAIGQLSKPPHPDGSLILARVLRREVRRHRLAAAVDAGLAWCTRQGA